MKNKLSIINTCITLLLFLMSLQISGQTEQGRALPQFLFEKFSRGIIKMKNGTKNTAVLNYNMVDQELIFEQNGQYMSIYQPLEIDTVFMQNRIFVPMEEGHLFEVLATGKVTFFLEQKSKYTQVGTNTAYGMTSPTNGSVRVTTVKGANSFRTVDVPDNVTVSPASLNWVRKNGTMGKFTTERGFLKIFPEKEAELKQFIKSEKISIRNREDLIKLGNYCNELLK